MSAFTNPAEQREHLYKLLKGFNTAMLVTYGDDEHLRVRPMAIAQVADDGQVWFITNVATTKAHEIEHDSRVHLVCQKDHTAYLSIGGRASVVHDRAKVEQLWNEMFRVWFPEGKDDPGIALIAMVPEIGEYWDNQGVNRIKYLFEAARAYATGSTPQVEEGKEHGMARL